jgi:hypothetical protein
MIYEIYEINMIYMIYEPENETTIAMNGNVANGCNLSRKCETCVAPY